MQHCKDNVNKTSVLKRLKQGFLLLLIAPMLAACGLHYNVKGTVVNAQTNEPVQGAVVAIRWMAGWPGPPELGTSRIYDLTMEDLTDETGSFTIPKYPLGDYYMAVYQKGYVCWSSDTIFNQYGKTEDEMYIRLRKYQRVENGMVVKMVPKGENFPDVKHARFVYMSIATQLSAPIPLFDEIIIEERNTFRNSIGR